MVKALNCPKIGPNGLADFREQNMTTYQVLYDYMTQRGFRLETGYANGTESWRYPPKGRIVINYLTDNDDGTCSGYLRKSILDANDINYQHILEHERGNVKEKGFQIKDIPWNILRPILEQLP